MKFIAEIDVMPLKEILDPQGKAVKLGLSNLGISEINDVRIGKHITIELEAQNLTDAESKTEMACKKLLANIIMEGYKYSVKSI
ncbi:MAG: phosphoribosylformylglycinamidine synthase subunit PurS [Cytophagales bacterium]|nr:MAG: phosphoribosylformylglycinamidine synthase subunit PurS [Cytophagales bacterium]TAG56152.1 MAG: phosphoribosylformylglycinamidine synthase subunit PurS [Cytophagales bacterium]